MLLLVLFLDWLLLSLFCSPVLVQKGNSKEREKANEETTIHITARIYQQGKQITSEKYGKSAGNHKLRMNQDRKAIETTYSSRS